MRDLHRNPPGAAPIALGFILTVASGVVTAQHNYPARPIRMVVAQAAGGPTDIVTRLYSARLSEQLGQQIVVDNRPGAGGSVAGEIVARAPADGYTLMAAANGTIAIAPHFIKLPYSVSRDLAPVALIGNSPFALMVNSALPATSVKELIALAKAKPATINFGSSGQGATSHLAGEMFKMMAGVNITHVPYKGASPALVGIVAGEIQMLISGLSSGLPYIKSRQLRALGVTSARRLSVLPGVPAIAETVPGYEAGSWYGVFTRSGTPRAIVEKLSRESVVAVNSADVHSKLVASGVEPETLTPDELAVKVRRETERWGTVVKTAGIKVE
jgi:tripartite-type tricarboxylate transporter receptor subunit TctC